jgi:hypothetical protein
MTEFIGEDDLDTFEGYLRYQGLDPGTLEAAELESWRDIFEESRARKLASPKVGLMKFSEPIPNGEHRYAVAFREGPELWLTLWVRRSSKGEFFVMIPRSDREWNPHASYHLDGTKHMKSHGRKFLVKKAQPLTDVFRGAENIGQSGGHGPKSVGAICDPNVFSGVVEVPPSVLGPIDGSVVVDLVEPGADLISCSGDVVKQAIFQDTIPWIVIRIVASSQPDEDAQPLAPAPI